MEKLVKIKTWKRMEEEYGVTEIGNIEVPSSFTIDMEKKLPENRIICCSFSEVVGKYIWGFWTIDNEMIEEELNPEDYPEYFL